VSESSNAARIKALYYTAAEARDVLGLTEDSFQYWVKSEKIHKVTLPGRIHGLYSRREVNKLAQETVEKMLAEEERIVEETSSTKAPDSETVEMPVVDLVARLETLAHSLKLYKKHTINVEKRLLSLLTDLELYTTTHTH
jgi:hypothetical protein